MSENKHQSMKRKQRILSAVVLALSILRKHTFEEKIRFEEIVQDFPGGSAGKESASNAGDLSSITGLGRSPGEGNSYPLQYSGLENSMGCINHRSQRVRHD